MIQAHALPRNAIQIGRLVDPAAIATQGLCGVVIAHDKEDIRAGWRRRLSGKQGRQTGEQGDQVGAGHRYGKNRSTCYGLRHLEGARLPHSSRW